MPYCGKCDRHFDSARALKQHREASSRHEQYINFSSWLATPVVRPSTQATTLVAQATILTPRDDEPSEMLISSLTEFYSSGEYSDLVISCGGKEYRVHRVLVCAQSKFFAAACRDGFKEAQEGNIILPDDNPRLIHIMVYYFYHLDYDVQGQNQSGHFDRPETKGDGADASEPTLVTHAKVYALAEKYIIDGLKGLALRKFKAATESLDVDHFLQATQEVYTSTIEGDRGLRDVIVAILFNNPRWLDESKVQHVIKDLGALAFDLVMYTHRNGRV
ncbi:BTB/POZ protein [Podospora aff. communis PSN243]|uniref:BTB/POZ protein n=1 Tax=Podospora aff. communis PSN243 TaxID=3040156 RepID=A0AAV9GG18_9PEZI|nr:BTB/POZ protein [Podospora aff. communis PSN243]